MPATNGIYTRILLALALFPAIAWSKDGVQTYSVPKEPAPKLLSLGSTQQQPGETSKPLSWTVPNGWEEKPASGIRLGTFIISGQNDAKANLAIMTFPGDVGGEAMNVNRWRNEVGLNAIDQKDIKSEIVAIGSASGKLYEFVGSSQSVMVGWLIKEDTSYFFKMRGDNAVVAAAKPAMVEFLKSVKFLGAPSMTAQENIISNPNVENPHGALPGGVAALPDGHPSMESLLPPDHGIMTNAVPVGHPQVDAKGTEMPAGHPKVDAKAGMSAGAADMAAAMAATAAPAGPQPTWQAPANWKERPATQFVVKSFTVTDDKAGKATVTISSLPGTAGGTLSNINRWRGQMGLPGITDTELPSATKTVAVGADKGTMVDLTGKSGRMVAIMAPHGSEVWFYKLVGDATEVERELPNLLNLAKTVRYP